MDIQKILGLALIPFFFVIIAILVALNITTVYEPPFLLLVLNTVFLGIVPLVIAYISSRVFQRSGSISMFLIGSGMLIIGLGSISAGWLILLSDGPNLNVTMFNTSAWISSIIILTGAVISQYGSMFWKSSKRAWIVAAAYSMILFFVALFSLATMQGLVPLFFIQGVGPTVIRQIILENAVLFFAISSVLFMFRYLKKRSDFLFWNSVSFALVSTGLFAVFFQISVGSLIGWVGRSAQYLGFVFALYAVLIARRAAIGKGLPIDAVISNFFVDAEQSYKQLVETATDAIVTFDEDYRVLLWNMAAERMFGYTRDEAIGLSFPELAIDDRYIAVIKNEDEDIPVEGNHKRVTESVEIAGKRKDGTLFPVELTISRRRQEGSLIRTCILRDLTVRKRAETALRESEERYRTLVESVDEAIILQEKTGEILTWNRAAERLFGATAREVLGHTATSRKWKMIREDGTEFSDSEHPSMHTLATGEACKNIVMGITSASGSFSWVNINTNPLFSEGDTKPYAVVISLLDITERKKAEDTLRESKEFVENLITSMQDGFSVLDSDGVQIDVNAAFCQMTGFSREELIGVGPPHPYWPQEALEEIERGFQKTLRGEFSDVELTFMRKNGERFPVIVSPSWVQDKQGNVVSYFATVKDITERKQAEVALRKSERKYRNIIETAQEGIWTLDSNFHISFVNEKMAGMLGYTQHEMIGRSFAEFIPEGELPDATMQVEFRKKGMKDTYERRFLHRNGDIRIMLTSSATIYDSNGTFSGSFAMFTDITERKRAEERAVHLASFPHLTPVLILEADLHGAIVYANPAIRKATETMGESDPRIFIPQDIRDRLNGTVIAQFVHEVREIEIHGQVFRENVYFTPEFSSLRVYATDITKRKQAEDTLRESEGRFRTILHSMQFGIIMIDANSHTILDANQKSLDMIGGTKETVLGSVCHSFICPAELGRCPITDLAQAIDSSERILITTRGEKIPILKSVVPTILGGKKVLIESFIDITERKRAEEVLQESENRYRNVVEDQTEFICRFTPDGTLTFVNDAYCRYFGLKRDECIGKRHTVALPPDDVSLMNEHIRSLTLENPVASIRQRIIMPSGEVRWQRWSDRALFDKDGHVVEYQSVGRDITDVVKAEEALRDSEERYHNVIEDQIEFICRFTPDGTLTFVNDAYCRYFGLNKDRCIGSRHSVVFPVDDARQMKKHLDELTPENPVGFIEHRITMPSGEVRWHRWSDRALFDKDGHVIEYQSVGKDITERKQAEFQREALIRELEEKNAELERFTYTISHDLKSPLITIRGFLGHLEKDALNADTVSFKKDINRIKSATNTMEDLLRDLLALSRIGRIVSPPAMVAFTTIAEDAVELLDGVIQKRKVTVEIAPDMPVVNVDCDRIREAVMNLCENAIKFMGDQPHPKIGIGVRYDRDKPVFFVQDNGIGIDPQYHTKIFNLFEQLDANTEGSGTGLAIVQRIIEVHGGKIWVESVGANQGSTFCFTLPGAEQGGAR